MRKLLTLFLALMATTATLFASSGTCGENVTWDLTGGVLTISGTGPMTEFASDSEVPWKSQLSSITTVIIEDGVTSIGKNAFYNCKNLSSVTMPSSVTTIGVVAFRTCESLTAITIPEGVQTIGWGAFRECGLTSFTFPSSITNIGDRVLASSDNLVKITCKATTPPTCTSDAFTFNKSVPLYVPAESVEAYSSATGWSVFTSIQAISSGSSGTCGENVNWELIGGVLTISGTGPMDDYASSDKAPWYNQKESITKVIIENGVTTIGNYAFFEYAITSVKLPNSLTSIGDLAFNQCSSLTSITFPSGVTTIGEYAFAGCWGLQSITCEATTPPALRENVFSWVDKSIPVKVPDAYVSAYQAASGWSDFTNIQGISSGGESSGSCGENVNWVLKDGVLTISGTGPMRDWNSYSIVPWYKERTSVTTIIIEDGVTYIGKNAFYQCNASTAVTIPNSVTTIGNHAFRACEFTEITLPDNLTTLGEGAFAKCYSLTAIILPSNVTSIGAGAFNGDNALTEITCEATTPPTCGDDVFGGVDMSIPVYVPDAYVSAYQAASGWSDFTNIQGISSGGVTWDLTGGVLTISGTGPMPDYGFKAAPWFSAHNSITSAIIEDGITSIGEGAFSYCENLLSVTIPNSVTSIHGAAFTVCTSLLSVTIPNNVTTIGTYAFNDCKALTEITIPENVTSIGECAFKSCYGLTEITCKAVTPPTLGINAFDDVDKYIPVKVPDESVSAYQAADGWSDFTKIQGMSGGISGSCGENVNWVLKDGVLTISGTGPMTFFASTYEVPWFSERSSIISVIIEDGVTTIGDYAFNGYTDLTSVTIGNSVSWIRQNAFKGCTGLSAVIIPNSVEYIDPWTFEDCTGLNSVTFGSSVRTIGASAFYNCSGLTSLILPASVSSIADFAFSDCSKLANITCKATTPPACGVNVFNNVDNAIPVYVPDESVSAYKVADEWNYFTNIQGISGGGSKEIYAALSGSTMTIYYDDQKASHSDLLENWTPEEGTSFVPEETRNSITKAVIDASMVDARPTSNYFWFSNLEYLITIDGLANLNTSEVTNMEGMFNFCNSLTSLDVSSFNTSSVMNMSGMFNFCNSLTSLDVSSFNTSSVMDMFGMFQLCSSLTSLDVSNFNTAKVEAMNYMFAECSALKTIYCDDAWNPGSSDDMFDGCTALVGGKGTKYDAGHVNAAYARPDGLDDQPGYFTAKGVTWNLTDGVLTISGKGPMEDYSGKAAIPWYAERRSIVSVIIEDGVTSIGKHAFNECINIASVQIAQTITSIGNYAFRKCAALTSLTIPAAVISIGKQAFMDCSGLTEITCEAVIPPTLNEDVFSGVDKSIPVYVPAKSVSAYQAADGWSDFTNIQAIPSNILWSVIDGVLTISGTGAMEDFASETETPWYSESASVTSIVIKDGVTSIGSNAFAEFTSLSSVTIAASVTDIALFAFYNCFNLEEITCAGTTPPTLDENAFYGVPPYIPVYVPAEALSAYKASASWAYFENITVKLTPEEQVEVNKVTDLINAIFASGEITLESEPAIVAAREAYNALAPHLQAAVYNYESLVEAEATLAALKANIPIITDGWVHYDDGVFYSSFKLGGNESWGIRIPANTVEEKALTMVSMYAYVAGEYTVEVYNGGATPAEGKKLSSQLVNLPTAGDFNNVTLAEPVPVDPTQDIWVIFCNTAGLKGPMSACAKTGATNGSWYFIPDDGWYAFGDIAWMIRAFFETYTGEALIDGINYFLDGSDLTAQVLDLSGDKYVGDIVVPEKATYINDFTVTSINSEAFTNSPELLSVSLPKTVNWIEPGSFLRNPKLTAINVAPANTTYSSLDGVLFNTVQTELIAYPTGRAGAYVVPEGVESILDEAFTDNANLTAITLPASLIDIASLAFEECTGLTAITSKAVNAPAAGSDAFHKVNKSIPVYVPQKGLASYKAEYEWKDFTNFITIEDKEAADAVIVKIDAIGAVAYTTECKDRIDAARNAYDALTAEQKALVPAEKLAILTAAEKTYADLKAQAEADQAAADIVIGQINAIGTVTLSSEPAIVAARQAYDALTDAQKALVTNYAVLTAAEVKLEILKKQAESDAAAAAAVTDLINGIGTVTYTTDCKERIDAAREAYNALTDAQKALVTNLGTLTAAEKAYADLKAKAEADQAAADIVIGKINAIGVVSYSEASKALIDDARAAYDALTDAQKGLIPAATYKVLTDAEQAYADLKAKAAADLAAANIVITKINAIGSVTLSSEPAIVDARAAYNALTTDQKALVTNYSVLTAAEKALADLKAKAAADQAAADNVIAQINAIGTVTLSSEPAIVAARAAYNALTADQKALVTNLSTLTAAEAKLDQLKKQAAADQAAADLVIGKINAIGTVSYSEASKALIDAARTAYDALTAAQQALVTNYDVLEAAEIAYADLKAKAEADQAAANAVIAEINAIGEVTLASEPAIVAARAAYNALTADQKALVSNYSVLTAAEAKLEVLKKQAESDEAAAAAVSNLISGIGTVTYTTECKARIDAAREAYEALTDVQKALVTNLATLTAAEKAYADLKAKAEADQAAANTVIAQIDAIGEVTLASEPAIVAARSAYNALTADQKALVSNYSVLTAAEAKLEVLKQQAEADQAAATAVIGKINAIGTVAYDEASKARIDDARHAYDALTAAQKALVTNLDVLLAAEQAYADLKAQAEVIAAAKQQLVDLVSEATALKAVAAMYAPSAVGEIEAIIASAQATINDPNATLEEIYMKYENLQYDFELEANKLLEEAKEQLKQSIRALYLPGDYPSWYASAIIPALDQVDAITWDFSMTVQENILLFQATGQALYNNAKSALEALRANDTRELVSSCTFTGFADAIQLDMTWNSSALNKLVSDLNASAATEPYHLEADGCMLGKWDPVEEQMVEVMGEKITEGQYQFVAYVTINGEEAKTYRFPKATEAVLTVTVDGKPWTVDLSGITIDANYSYTYIASPLFEISKSEDVELIEIEPVKTQKIYHNGHFYILRGDHIFDIRGTLVK